MARNARNGSWNTDDDALETYFHACHENYKNFLGEKTEKQRLKLYAVYKQATAGDCKEDMPFDSAKRKKWEMWTLFQGMEKKPAMRRYVTLLRQLEPSLVIIEVIEKPPAGFPTTEMGEPICARCNCKAGCISPLIVVQERAKEMFGKRLFDDEAPPLEERLDTDATLLSYDGLSMFMRTEQTRLRCKYGNHVSITAHQAKQFELWFNHVGAGGFKQYNTETDRTLANMVVGMMERVFWRAHDMQVAPDDWTYEERLDQVQKCFGIRKAFFEITGSYFQLQVPCTRDVAHCNAKRAADGHANHTHAMELEFPEPNYKNFEVANNLRKELNRIGVDPTTNVVSSSEERENILGMRLAYKHKLEFEVSEARRRQRARNFFRPIQLKRMRDSQAEQFRKQLETAIRENNQELTVALVRKGADFKVETEGGITGVIRATLNGDRGFLRMLIEAGADINAFSQKSGMNSLCWACRRGDNPMCKAILLLPNAIVACEGPTGITPLNSAAESGRKSCCLALVDFVMTHSVLLDLDPDEQVRELLNHQNRFGDTALHIAAKSRQLPVCRTLMELGASKLLRNNAGRTAIEEAKDRGFVELANWFEKTLLGLDNCLPLLEVGFTERQVKLAKKRATKAFQKLVLRSKPIDDAAEGQAKFASNAMTIALKKGLKRGQEHLLHKHHHHQHHHHHNGKHSPSGAGGLLSAPNSNLTISEHDIGNIGAMMVAGAEMNSELNVLEDEIPKPLSLKQQSMKEKKLEKRNKRHKLQGKHIVDKIHDAESHHIQPEHIMDKYKTDEELKMEQEQLRREKQRKEDELKVKGDFGEEDEDDENLSESSDENASDNSVSSVEEEEEEEEDSLKEANKEIRNRNALKKLQLLANLENPSVVAADLEQLEATLPLSVDLIAKHGCPPNFESRDGVTALLAASYAGQPHAVRRLLAEGATTDYQNRNGRTALMAAASGGDVECCIELIKAGASLYQVDLDGKSAGRFAQEAANEVVARFLVNVMKSGLEGGLRTFAAQEKAAMSHEKLMVSYGGSGGECGGPDDDAGDSYLWRLPRVPLSIEPPPAIVASEALISGTVTFKSREGNATPTGGMPLASRPSSRSGNASGGSSKGGSRSSSRGSSRGGDISFSKKNSPEEMEDQLRAHVKRLGRRFTMVRPNETDLAYLNRYKMELQKKKTKIDIGQSKASAAKGKIESSTSSALMRIKLMAEEVARCLPPKLGHEEMITADGLEEWKNRLDEVTRRWVDQEALPPDVIAAKKKPRLFIGPAEMVLAVHYLSRKEMDKAEKLLLETKEIQEKAELRDSGASDGKFAVGLCHRGLADVAEYQERLDEALAHRETSLGLIATALDPHESQVRVSVDIVASTHLIGKDWSLAIALYKAVADEMRQSNDLRKALAEDMEARARAVPMLRDRADMALNDLLSFKEEQFFRDPALKAAFDCGKTIEHLEALMCDQTATSAWGRKLLKKHLTKDGAPPSALNFYLTALDFSRLPPTDEEFKSTCKKIYKTYVKPPSKLSMLTQGIRNDLAEGMKNPSPGMYAKAMHLVLETLFVGVYGSSKGWIDTEEGRIWKLTRDVERSSHALHMTVTLQIRTRYLNKKRQKLIDPQFAFDKSSKKSFRKSFKLSASPKKSPASPSSKNDPPSKSSGLSKKDKKKEQKKDKKKEKKKSKKSAFPSLM